MDLGYSNAAACRAVGVTVRTGRRWRHGRPPEAPRGHGARPARAGSSPPSPGSGRYLGEDERVYIADRLLEGASMRAIAAALGRSPSTIGREVARNAGPDGRYRPHAAHARAAARRPRPKPRRLAPGSELRRVVWRWLGRKWSPQQIAVMLRRRFPGRPEMHVCHETIYQALYVQGRGELRREIAAALRSGRARRRPRRQPAQRRPRFAEPMLMISDRPAEADDRRARPLGRRPDHRQGSASQIGTLVERATRCPALHCPPAATPRRQRRTRRARPASRPARRSLTWDQGSEMARHASSPSPRLPVYFCDPHSPWQRGTNENTNGLLRQYFPKGTDFYLERTVDFTKLRMSTAPQAVSIDSGWNWTPSTGADRCRTPIGSGPVRAVITRSGGSVRSSMISEW